MISLWLAPSGKDAEAAMLPQDVNGAALQLSQPIPDPVAISDFENRETLDSSPCELLGSETAVDGNLGERHAQVAASATSSVRPPSADRNFVLDPFQQTDQYCFYDDQATSQLTCEPFPQPSPGVIVHDASCNVSQPMGTDGGGSDLAIPESDSHMRGSEMDKIAEPQHASYGNTLLFDQSGSASISQPHHSMGHSTEQPANSDHSAAVTLGAMSNYMDQCGHLGGGHGMHYPAAFVPNASPYLQQHHPQDHLSLTHQVAAGDALPPQALMAANPFPVMHMGMQGLPHRKPDVDPTLKAMPAITLWCVVWDVAVASLQGLCGYSLVRFDPATRGWHCCVATVHVD